MSLAVVQKAEMSVVGGLMWHPEMLPAIAEIVQEGDFVTDRFRRTYGAIMALWEDQKPVDEMLVVGKLKERGDLDAVGGIVAVSELTSNTTGTNLEYHARIIAGHGAKRRLLEAVERIKALSDTDGSPELLQAEAERLLAEAAPKVAGKGLVKMRDLLPGVLEHLEEITRPNTSTGIRTGLKAVDDKLGPMERGDMILVAGRPSMGKSAYGVCNIAADVALRQRKSVAIFSLETKSAGVVKRIIQSEARTNMAAARRNGRFLDEEYARMATTASYLNGAPLWIDHTPGMTIDQMRIKLRRAMHELGDLALVIVDYLQLMTDRKSKGRYEEVSAIGAGLKRVATEFDVPVMALSQLSRAVEARPDKRPMMSDLRESGTLEQDADVVALLYRPEYYYGPKMKTGRGKDEHEFDVAGKAEIILAKVRDGETGSALVGFDAEHTHFYDLGYQR